MPPLEPDGRMRHYWDKEWEEAGRSEAKFNLRNCFDVAFYGDFVDWATQAKESADEPPFKIALDLGCGIGVTTRLLQDKNPDGLVIGIDYQDTCIETATQLSQGNIAYKQTEFANGDIRDVERLRAIIAERLPEGQKPDLIICNDTLPHLKDQEQRLRDWVSLLSDNGRLVLSWGIIEETTVRSLGFYPSRPRPRNHLLESAKLKHDENGQESVDMSTYHAWTFLFPDDVDANKHEFTRLCYRAGIQLQALKPFLPPHHGSQRPTNGVPILIDKYYKYSLITGDELGGLSDEEDEDTTARLVAPQRQAPNLSTFMRYCGVGDRYERLSELIDTWMTNEEDNGRFCREKNVQVWAEVVCKQERSESF